MILPSPLRIEPIAGYSPTIGRLVGMLTYARSTTFAAVEGLTMAELDHLQDANSNSIGALLAHFAVVERAYQILTFEERELSAKENELWSAALKLGADGRRSLRGYPLEHYLEELTVIRQVTLDALAAHDDAWLERAVVQAPKINAHWAWFHIAEDEINHRGQIRWLRARLRKRDTPRDVVLAWVDAFNRRDAHAAAALYHDDAVNTQVAAGEPTVGRTAILEDLLTFFRAFPDNYTRPVNLFEDGEWAVLEWDGGGTWRGEFTGLPANGRAFTLQGCGFFHVVGGKIKFQRGYWDKVTWFSQLGIPIEP